MNLKTHISEPLWLDISNTYESENYSHAIVDAMHHLSDVLREKSGVDSDGVQLVGKVLGGNTPILRVNKLQTESERNVQKGLEQILRGMYTGVRNPRSHEQIEDSKDTADAIIYFTDYLLGILAESQEPFTIPGFLERVFDPLFVRSQQYAESLVEEIPVNKRLDVMIEIYRMKQERNANNLRCISHALLSKFDDKQMTDFLNVVSQELKTTCSDEDIRNTLAILKPELWPQINTTARLRIENLLITAIVDGEAIPDGDMYIEHWNDGFRFVESDERSILATWANDYLEFFNDQDNVFGAFYRKLAGDYGGQLYIFHYFLLILPSVANSARRAELLISGIVKAVKKDESDILLGLLGSKMWSLPRSWSERLREEIDSLKSTAGEDDIPF